MRNRKEIAENRIVAETLQKKLRSQHGKLHDSNGLRYEPYRYVYLYFTEPLIYAPWCAGNRLRSKLPFRRSSSGVDVAAIIQLKKEINYSPIGNEISIILTTFAKRQRLCCYSKIQHMCQIYYSTKYTFRSFTKLKSSSKQIPTRYETF